MSVPKIDVPTLVMHARMLLLADHSNTQSKVRLAHFEDACADASGACFLIRVATPEDPTLRVQSIAIEDLARTLDTVYDEYSILVIPQRSSKNFFIHGITTGDAASTR